MLVQNEITNMVASNSENVDGENEGSIGNVEGSDDDIAAQFTSE